VKRFFVWLLLLYCACLRWGHTNCRSPMCPDDLYYISSLNIRSSNQPWSFPSHTILFPMTNKIRNFWLYSSCCNQICQTFCIILLYVHTTLKKKKISLLTKYVPQSNSKPPYNTTKEELKPRSIHLETNQTLADMIFLQKRLNIHSDTLLPHPQRSRFLYYYNKNDNPKIDIIMNHHFLKRWKKSMTYILSQLIYVFIMVD